MIISITKEDVDNSVTNSKNAKTGNKRLCNCLLSTAFKRSLGVKITNTGYTEHTGKGFRIICDVQSGKIAEEFDSLFYRRMDRPVEDYYHFIGRTVKFTYRNTLIKIPENIF